MTEDMSNVDTIHDLRSYMTVKDFQEMASYERKSSFPYKLVITHTQDLSRLHAEIQYVK